MSYSFAELKSLSDEKLVEEHDNVASTTAVGISYFLDELRYREQNRIAEKMEGLTDRIWCLTAIVTIATIINVAIAAVPFVQN